MNCFIYTLCNLQKTTSYLIFYHTAEYSMSLFWIQGATNGTHVFNDDGSVADLMTIATEESEEMEPNSRFIIAREQGFQWFGVSPESRNGFLCQVAARRNP